MKEFMYCARWTLEKCEKRGEKRENLYRELTQAWDAPAPREHNYKPRTVSEVGSL